MGSTRSEGWCVMKRSPTNRGKYYQENGIEESEGGADLKSRRSLERRHFVRSSITGQIGQQETDQINEGDENNIKGSRTTPIEDQ